MICINSHKHAIRVFNNLEEQFNIIHQYKYDYSKVEYFNMKTPITIVCPIHGEFKQRPYSHKEGYECKECGITKTAKSHIKSTESFITSANCVHNNIYDYSNSIYTRATANINIICKKHGKFTQVASTHLRGSGCPSCAISGFDSSKPAIVYYLSINDGEAYKIGITNRSIRERFNKIELSKITVLNEWYFEDGSTAYRLEQCVLKAYISLKYTGDSILEFGNTELFIKDILNE